MGRPSKLTSEAQSRITAALRAGNYFEQSVRAAGVGPSTAYRWMEMGEGVPELGTEEFNELDMEAQIVATAMQPYREFREAVLEAIAAAEVRDILLIDKAAQTGSWQAAAWKRERLSPDRWGRTDKVIIQQAAIEELGKQVVGIVTDVLESVIADPVARTRAAEAILERIAGLGGAPAAGRPRT